jgi:hypothetical protein
MTLESQKKANKKYREKIGLKKLQFDFYDKDFDLYYKFMSMPQKYKNEKLRYLLDLLEDKDFELIQE